VLTKIHLIFHNDIYFDRSWPIKLISALKIIPQLFQNFHILNIPIQMWHTAVFPVFYIDTRMLQLHFNTLAVYSSRDDS